MERHSNYTTMGKTFKANAGRTSKGSVAILVSNNRLQLRFNYGGKRYYLSLGLPDTKTNRRAAELKAQIIERDIAYGEVDLTLGKYKPQVTSGEDESSATRLPSLGDLYQQYTEYKRPQVSPATLRSHFEKTLQKIAKLPTQDLNQAESIQVFITGFWTPPNARAFLVQLSACCKWAMKAGMVPTNPFAGMASDVKTHRKASNEGYDINPFTNLEQERIIAAFYRSRYYTVYAPYVKFCFLTGCRPSEAVALCWKNYDGSFIWFEESVVNEQKGLVKKKGLKTQERRKFPVNDQLRELLTSIHCEDVDPDALIFPAPKGGWIDIHNFCNRGWRKILGSLDITYRKPYNCRHTFITRCLESGISIPQVAKWVGNSPEVIMRHYAGVIQQVQVPTF